MLCPEGIYTALYGECQAFTSIAGLPTSGEVDPARSARAGGETQTQVVSSAYSSSLIRSSSSLGSSMRTRKSQPEPYGSVLTTSGLSSSSPLTSMTWPLLGAWLLEDASSYSTPPS